MTLIAQASSGFNDFVGQIPLPFVLMLCGSVVLLVIAVFAIVRARLNRQSRQTTPKQSSDSPPSRSPSRLDTGELPDLDLLVDVPPAAPVSSSPLTPSPRPVTAPTTRSSAPDHTVEVVTILRDVVDGGLMIQMGDQTVRDLAGDPAFRNRFLKIMRELGPLVRQAQEHSDAEAAPAPAAVEAEADPIDEATASLNAALGESEDEDVANLADLMAVEEVEEAPAPPKANAIPPPPKPDGSMPGDLPKYSLDESPAVIEKRGMLGRTKKEYKPVPELNIAEAIQTYLQHKLIHTPEFAGRSIHVLSAPDGGVNIEVDGKIFEAVGDVTDTEVRAFLTETIAEWQERNI